MVTESFSWYSSKGPVSTTNRYSSVIDSAKETRKYKYAKWDTKLSFNREVLKNAVGLEALQAVDSEDESAEKMERSNKYLKTNASARAEFAKHRAFLKEKRAEILRNLDMEKSTLETAVTSYSTPQMIGPSNESLFYESQKGEEKSATSAPQVMYSHMRKPMWIGDTVEHTGRNPYRARARGKFSSVPDQDTIDRVDDLIKMCQPTPIKKRRTSLALTETLGEIGRIATYVTKAAAVALATLLPMKTAYAPTAFSNQKPTYSANLVNQGETYSNIEVPNLRLIENSPAVNSAPAIVEKVESATSTPKVAPVIKTDTAIVKSSAKSIISLEQRASPMHIDKFLTLINQRTIRVPYEYTSRETPKPTSVAEKFDVSYEPAPMLKVMQKPSIPDSFWEVRTPTGQIVYFNAGNTKPIAHDGHYAEPPIVNTSSKSEFIDSKWFANAKVKAERMERVRQPITKDWLAEHMKSIEERLASKPN